jgi:hypothetical protein
MITFYSLLTILVIHYVFDFVLQSHWMASNKSKSNYALTTHVSVYGVGVLLMAAFNYSLFPSMTALYLFWGVNCALHWITDYITSRESSKRFGTDWHNFFSIIGFDQTIHYVTLLGTFIYFTS